MSCIKCKVIDENILIFAMRGEDPHAKFMNLFLSRRCKMCLSSKIRKGYANKLRRFKGNKEEFKDDRMIRRIQIALYRDLSFEECPYEYSNDNAEKEDKYSLIPRKDRYLVTVSEYFRTFIVTDDDELYDAVNSDEGMVSSCKRSEEAIDLIG